MTEKFEIYRCNICQNIIQVMAEGAGELVCCNEPMELLKPQEERESELGEKHTPEFETDVNGRFVRLKHHPMTEEHYIEFIQVYAKDKSCLHTKFLRPKDIAEFDITGYEQELEAQEMCNIHGLWRNKND